jgi:hypothetical protein
MACTDDDRFGQLESVVGATPAASAVVHEAGPGDRDCQPLTHARGRSAGDQLQRKMPVRL